MSGFQLNELTLLCLCHFSPSVCAWMEHGMETSLDAVFKIAMWLLIPAAWVPLIFLTRWALAFGG